MAKIVSPRRIDFAMVSLAKETIAKSILRGETIFAIGYSEPNAGTDLASLKTQALPDKEGFKINGH